MLQPPEDDATENELMIYERFLFNTATEEINTE